MDNFDFDLFTPFNMENLAEDFIPATTSQAFSLQRQESYHHSLRLTISEEPQVTFLTVGQKRS